MPLIVYIIYIYVRYKKTESNATQLWHNMFKHHVKSNATGANLRAAGTQAGPGLPHGKLA